MFLQILFVVSVVLTILFIAAVIILGYLTKNIDMIEEAIRETDLINIEENKNEKISKSKED